MESFRKQNRFLIYLVNFSGLYMKSVETLTDNKVLLYFLTVWTKIAITLIPIYIGSAFKFLIFDEAPFVYKLAIFRRVMAFVIFLYKNVFFYLHRKEIESLIDLWDASFKEELYSENRAAKLKQNSKFNVKVLLILSWFLNLLAGLIYSVPPFFANTKKLSHPSGIPYREQSPDYELMIVFDFFRVISACISSVSVDCILVVFLSNTLVQLTHLRDSLTQLIKETVENADLSYNFEAGSTQIPDRNLVIMRNIPQNPKTLEKFESTMRIWVSHHQKTIRFFQAIKALFTPIASLQLVYVVFYTCFTAFHLVGAKIGVEEIVLPFVAASNLVSLFFWCHIGVQIDSVSSNLFSDAFGESWFVFPRRIQTIFSFIMIRGWKPLTLKGISLFDLNLVTFFQVFKITYQLFAFMLHVSGKD